MVPCVVVAGERGQRRAGHFLLLAPVPEAYAGQKGGKGREGKASPWWTTPAARVVVVG
jgi:hypothetical protein